VRIYQTSRTPKRRTSRASPCSTTRKMRSTRRARFWLFNEQTTTTQLSQHVFVSPDRERACTRSTDVLLFVIVVVVVVTPFASARRREKPRKKNIQLKTRTYAPRDDFEPILASIRLITHRQCRRRRRSVRRVRSLSHLSIPSPRTGRTDSVSFQQSESQTEDARLDGLE
jgi:hypothetical protein